MAHGHPTKAPSSFAVLLSSLIGDLGRDDLAVVSTGSTFSFSYRDLIQD